MASAGDRKQNRIEMKHVFIAVIVIVSILSFIASIVMITIGYLNPFGTVGLGILGGGCVLYFATVLFLCSSGIWVKNRYYPEKNDYIEKVTLSSTEDISLLKPTLNVTSPAITEAGIINEMDCELDNKMVPLCSVSTVYSSVSSSVSTVPDKTILFNWQAGEAEGTLDPDVFSSSLTAMQHTDMKVQEKLKVKWGSTEQIDPTSEWKIKNVENRKIADVPILYNNGKSVSDTPCQRKPVVMDFVGTTYSRAEEKQWMNHQISGQNKAGNNINNNPQISGKNHTSVMLCPVEGPLNSAAQSKHQHILDLSKLRYKNEGTNPQPKKYNQESKPALEKRKIHIGEKDIQVPGRNWSVIAAHDSWIHNPRVPGTSKGLKTGSTTIPETEKKHRSCERLDKISQERTKVPLQYLLPNTWVYKPENLQLSSQMTTSENLRAKGKVTKTAWNEKISRD